jgi:hypothetical protein
MSNSTGSFRLSNGMDNFKKSLSQVFIKVKFTDIKPDKSNINEVYNNNINIWYYFNSDSVLKKDGTKKISSKLDTFNNVFLLNPTNFIFCKTQNGFKLTEIDFINSELKLCEELNFDKLSITENKQFEFYKNYLLEKIKKPQQKGAIQNLFNFIDFLHTNIDNFNKYNDIKNELNLLNSERNNLEPENSFNDKLRFDEIQKEVEQKFNIIHKNIIQLIEDKATENRIFEFNRTQILELKQNSNSKDLEILLNLRDKYFTFLEKTNSEYFPKFLFSDLNRLLKELFDFFDKSYKNEFKMFESSTIVKHFRNKDFTKIEDIEPQQKEIKIPDEVKKELHNNIFKDNAFVVWQSMFVKFKITESNRTDIDFMFEVMKYHNLIYDNIKYVDIQNWINNVYEISFDKIKFTDHKAKSNDKRLIIYNDIISK